MGKVLDYHGSLPGTLFSRYQAQQTFYSPIPSLPQFPAPNRRRTHRQCPSAHRGESTCHR
jgi:hypothetical protein